MGCIVSKLFWDFNIFLYLQGPLTVGQSVLELHNYTYSGVQFMNLIE